MTSQLRPWERHPPARLRLPEYPALPIHVIVGTRSSRPCFRNRALARIVHEALEEHPRTVAAVLMPDHLHWVLDDATEVTRWVARFKSATTRLGWQLGSRGAIWQRSFFDSVLRGERVVRQCIDYVVANPVRAGLADGVDDYPFTVSPRWSKLEL